MALSRSVRHGNRLSGLNQYGETLGVAAKTHHRFGFCIGAKLARLPLWVINVVATFSAGKQKFTIQFNDIATIF